MTIKADVNLRAAFEGRETKAETQTGDVPERIEQDAPTPVLRPSGSWKARADAVDQRVRESEDAAKAKKEWAARIKTTRKRGLGMGMSFRKISRDW